MQAQNEVRVGTYIFQSFLYFETNTYRYLLIDFKITPVEQSPQILVDCSVYGVQSGSQYDPMVEKKI